MARGTRTPERVRDAVGRRPLAAEELDDDRWLALTRDALVVVGTDGEARSRPWHEVERGDWDGEARTLTVHWLGEPEPERFTTRAEGARELPLAFRDRVDASIVHVETAPAPGGGTLRAAVRRTASGELLVQVTAVGRVQHGPDLEAQADALEARARDAVGL